MAVLRDPQDRTFNTGVDIVGFNASIANFQGQTATGILDVQGFTYEDELETCPHCGKVGEQSDGRYAIWHFDNCKERPQ